MNKKLENNIDSRATVYQELCNSYRAIDDFRAKLLGFLPLASGTGIFLLIRPVDGDLSDETKTLLWAAGAFGFFITLGLFCYELYGVKKCHALINAGKELEEDLGIDAQRGQFTARPRDVAGLINEPFAAGVIYPTVLAAWTFLALVFTSQDARLWAIIVFVIGFAVVLVFNFKLGKEENVRRWLNYEEDQEVTVRQVWRYLNIKLDEDIRKTLKAEEIGKDGKLTDQNMREYLKIKVGLNKNKEPSIDRGKAP